MTVVDHLRWVRTGMRLACVALALVVAAQLLSGADYKGLPFLAFGIIVGALGASLLVRVIWERHTVSKD